MRVRINKITLENFKCFKGKKEIDFGGNNAVIRAENGVGKTTIADAFMWLHYDKDTSGRKAFKMRPLGKDNKPIKGLEVAVEDHLLINGVIHKFRKIQKERIVKDNIVGFTNLYEIDDVPKSETEFNNYHADNIMPEKIFKMLTDLAFFNDDKKMPWPKRREVLLDVAGKVSVPDGYEELIKKQAGRTINDYEAVLKSQRKKHVEERDKIPTRIDEKQRGLDEYVQNDSTEEVEKQRDGCKEKITGLEAKRATLRNSEAERAGHVEHINRLTGKRGHRETVLKNQTGPVDALRDEKRKLLDDHANKCHALNELQHGPIRGIETALVSSKNTIEASLLTIQSIKKEYAEAKDTSTDSVLTRSVAHTKECKLANDDLRDKAKKFFNENKSLRQGRLKEIEARGEVIKESIEACKTEQEKQQVEHNAMLEKETAMKADIAQSSEAMRKRIGEIDEAIKNKPEVDPSTDTEWKVITAEIINTQSKLGDPLTEQLEAIENEIKFANELLVKLNDCLAQADTIRKAKVRITELEARQAKLGRLITALDGELEEINQFHADQNTLIEEAVNGMFEYVTFKLFEFYLNEGYKPCCICLLDGKPYPELSKGEKKFADIDVINTLSDYWGVEVTLFVDDAGDITLVIEAHSQMIKLIATFVYKCVCGKYSFRNWNLKKDEPVPDVIACDYCGANAKRHMELQIEVEQPEEGKVVA